MAFRVLKTSLKSILKDPDDDGLEPIIDCILRTNKVVSKTYEFIRMYCLDKFLSVHELPDLNKTFIKHCMRVVMQPTGRNVTDKYQARNCELTMFFDKYFKTSEKAPSKHLGQILGYEATQMETSYQVNIQQHYIQRLSRLIMTLDGEKVQKYKLKAAILFSKPEDVPEEFKDWYNRHVDVFFPRASSVEKGSIHYDICIDKKLTRYLKFSIAICQEFERLDKKLFQALPLRNSLIPKYIMIDSITLKCLSKKTWGEFLNLNHKIFRGKRFMFADKIATDGKVVSVLFEDKKSSQKKVKKQADFNALEKLSEENRQLFSQKTIVGCDPGQVNLLFMIGESGCLKYSAKQRRVESYSLKNSKNIILDKKRNKHVIRAETHLSKFCCKTVDVNKFADFVREKEVASRQVEEYYQKMFFRTLKWRCSVYTRKSEDRLCNNIKKKFGNDCVLAIGDWSKAQGSAIKGPPSTCIGLKRRLEKNFAVVLVNEYLTSKICCNCHERLQNTRHHHILKCKNCSDLIDCPEDKSSMREKFLNRDVNGASNILQIAKDWIFKKERNPVFSKSPVT